MLEQWFEIEDDILRLARLIDPEAFEPITQTHNFIALLREKKERRDAAIGKITPVFRKIERAMLDRLMHCGTNDRPN